MANIDFPTRYGSPRVIQLWEDLAAGKLPWVHTPRWGWGCTLTWQDVNGPYATLTATVAFSGTEADGNYVSTFYDASDVEIAVVTTARTGGDLATFEDIAEQHAIDIAAETDLEDYVSGAVNNGGSVVISGIQGQVFRVITTAPGGVTVAETHSAAVDLNSVAFDQGIPANVNRSWCLVHVTTTFGAGRTLTVGDAASVAGILGSTPVSLNATGRSGSVAADAEYQPRPELSYVPIATVALGDDPVLTQGSALIEILFTPNLVNTAA